MAPLLLEMPCAKEQASRLALDPPPWPIQALVNGQNLSLREVVSCNTRGSADLYKRVARGCFLPSFARQESICDQVRPSVAKACRDPTVGGDMDLMRWLRGFLLLRRQLQEVVKQTYGLVHSKEPPQCGARIQCARRRLSLVCKVESVFGRRVCLSVGFWESTSTNVCLTTTWC